MGNDSDVVHGRPLLQHDHRLDPLLFLRLYDITVAMGTV